MTATASETSGSNADPTRLLGSMSSVSAPATKPTGRRTTMAGILDLLARIWQPTARATVSPTPVRIWSVVMTPPPLIRRAQAGPPHRPGRMTAMQRPRRRDAR
jgi:hypothetical protein